MNTKIVSLILSVILLASSGSGALAKSADEHNRYFVKSTAAVWKNSFGVRHSFPNGFTATLTDWQLRVAKIFNIEVEPVRRLSILPVEGLVEGAATVGQRKDGQRFVPVQQLPWGIELMGGSINSEAADETSTGGKSVSKSVVIAVLDTGVLKTHPDLVARIAGCKDFTVTKGSPADGKCDDRNGHGTHVAGIIAADGGKDGKGIYGLAPQAEIFAYKVCDNSGACWADDVAAAMRAAVDNGAQIINLSIGSDVHSGLLAFGVDYAVSKGLLIVAAAGNDGPYQGSIDYPAALSTVIGVGALDALVEIPDWSSRGSNTASTVDLLEEGDIEFAAPGVNIESTWRDDGYAILSGTSMAAPHISGLAARLWPTDGENPASQVREALWKIVQDVLPEGEDDSSGFGIPVK